MSEECHRQTAAVERDFIERIINYLFLHLIQVFSPPRTTIALSDNIDSSQTSPSAAGTSQGGSTAEQKRRSHIKNGFETLQSLVPALANNPTNKVIMLDSIALSRTQWQNFAAPNWGHVRHGANIILFHHWNDTHSSGQHWIGLIV